VGLARAVQRGVSKSSLGDLELVFGSEFPTERAPERAAKAAAEAAKKLSRFEHLTDAERDALERLAHEGETWCDSEAPTSVAAERPLLPRPPRSPRL